MNANNGYICKDRQEVEYRIEQISYGKQLSKIPLPMVAETMTYYITDIGEVFGCQEYKSFFLVKPLKVEKRYSRGANIRVTLGHKQQINQYMQNLMWWTFVSKEYLPDINIQFKDGDVYNYQLNNLQRAKKDNSQFKNNLKRYSKIYKENFFRVTSYQRHLNASIELEDCKDIAANAFYEICEHDFKFRNKDQFIGVWKIIVKRRTFDFMTFNKRFSSLFLGCGEEKLGEEDRLVESIDTAHILQKQQEHVIREWLEGWTPTEIAERDGKTLSGISSCLTRGIQRLQQEYKNDIKCFQSLTI